MKKKILLTPIAFVLFTIHVHANAWLPLVPVAESIIKTIAESKTDAKKYREIKSSLTNAYNETHEDLIKNLQYISSWPSISGKASAIDSVAQNYLFLAELGISDQEKAFLVVEALNLDIVEALKKQATSLKEETDKLMDGLPIFEQSSVSNITSELVSELDVLIYVMKLAAKAKDNKNSVSHNEISEINEYVKSTVPGSPDLSVFTSPEVASFDKSIPLQVDPNFGLSMHYYRSLHSISTKSRKLITLWDLYLEDLFNTIKTSQANYIQLVDDGNISEKILGEKYSEKNWLTIATESIEFIKTYKAP